MHHIFIFATTVTKDYIDIHDANDYLLHNSYKHAKMTRSSSVYSKLKKLL